MKSLTVITATYNRAYCLHQVYESLLRQDCTDFVWLVIDDGSSDETRDLVHRWAIDKRVEIEYIYQPNGGMHVARNTAYANTRTPLSVVIDSDDWMADGAVERIIDFWRENQRDDVAGMISHNVDPNGILIGSEMPLGVSSCTIADFFGRHGGRGDKKFIYRSDLIRLNPYPVFPGEKYFPASYKFRLLDQRFKMLLMDSVTCVVDNNASSQGRSRYLHYQSCSRGFAFYRNEMLRIDKNPRRNLRTAIHYVAESRFAGEKNYIKNASRKGYVIVALPAGVALQHYLKTTKKTSRMG